MFVEERFCSMDKPLVGTLMAQLMTMKYDGSRGMQENIIVMTNIEKARLKSQRSNSINLMNQGADKGLKATTNKFKKKKNLPVNVSNGNKKEQMADKCHFCKKGHYKKDFQKHKAWFKKKGIPFNPVHKPN
ncbi:hypothetical protein E1A91_A04G064500v1 [Gossypium mustelinum]|uniref:Uncharacterized protein n=1 Tax=Gossypium mustelinum TaxID=34275 RepID=A0A5D2ZMR4_GOSMU|nr:hypothetical protein E1A91_A04G064500v1 [Gossypium mustelinum]